jgi:hypothetical protein
MANQKSFAIFAAKSAHLAGLSSLLMTSRKSSGSILAENAVEPTRSQNITVTWRRSAASRGCRGNRRTFSGDRRSSLQVGDGAQQFATMSERHNADLFEVLIGEVT